MDRPKFTIIGGKGQISDLDPFLEKVNSLSKDGAHIQLFDADMILGKIHLESAIEHALDAFENGENTAKNLTTEIALYASGERQISKAFEKVGVKASSKRFAIIFSSPIQPKDILATLSIVQDEQVLEPTADKLTKWGFSNLELNTIKKENVFDLVLEKVALLDVEKR